MPKALEPDRPEIPHLVTLLGPSCVSLGQKLTAPESEIISWTTNEDAFTLLDGEQ